MVMVSNSHSSAKFPTFNRGGVVVTDSMLAGAARAKALLAASASIRTGALGQAAAARMAGFGRVEAQA